MGSPVLKERYQAQVRSALEEEFNCEIPDEEAEKITTVQQAVDYVNAHTE